LLVLSTELNFRMRAASGAAGWANIGLSPASSYDVNSKPSVGILSQWLLFTLPRRYEGIDDNRLFRMWSSVELHESSEAVSVVSH